MKQNYPENDDAIIRSILEQINTPECDISVGVLKRLHDESSKQEQHRNILNSKRKPR